MYTPVEDAIVELERRQQDAALKQHVRDYLHDDIPAPLTGGDNRNAVLFRNVFTPDYELETFQSFTKEHKLREVLLEYVEDKFVTNNEDKYALGKLYFYLNTTGTSSSNMYGKTIIDFNSSQGKRISEIKTLSGKGLVEFHHLILQTLAPESLNSVYDISVWLHNHGGTAKEYYKQLLAFFVRDAILFDNFRVSGPEADFTQAIFAPAFDIVEKEFGLKPLICALQDPQDENNPKWWGYDKSKMQAILDSM